MRVTSMTSGELIEFRLTKKQCIKCGHAPALDWPYVCDNCQRELTREQEAKKQRQDAAELGPPPSHR